MSRGRPCARSAYVRARVHQASLSPAHHQHRRQTTSDTNDAASAQRQTTQREAKGYLLHVDEHEAAAV
eukprot:3932120-Rhodomonas_salina.1